MKKLFGLALIAAITMVAVGCSSEKKEDAPMTNSPATTPEVANKFGIPDWAINIPSEPGKAFYGVGSDAFKNASMMDRAFKGADTSARRQIADTMKTTIQGCTKRYARTVLTPDNQVHEEGLSQDVTRAITNWVLMGAEIVKHELSQDRETGLTTVYSLARIGFDSVAENLHRETSQAIQKVQENAKVAFDELDKLLADEHERNHPPVAPPADLPPLKKAE